MFKDPLNSPDIVGQPIKRHPIKMNCNQMFDAEFWFNRTDPKK